MRELAAGEIIEAYRFFLLPFALFTGTLKTSTILRQGQSGGAIAVALFVPLDGNTTEGGMDLEIDGIVNGRNKTNTAIPDLNSPCDSGI